MKFFSTMCSASAVIGCVFLLAVSSSQTATAQEVGANASLENEIKSLTAAVTALQTEIVSLKQELSVSGASPVSQKIFLRKELVQLGMDPSCGKTGVIACEAISTRICADLGYSASIKARIVPVPDITSDGSAVGSFLAAVMCR